MEKHEQTDLPETGAQGSKKNKVLLTAIIWAAVVIALALGAFFFANNYLVRWEINGTSMLPTIKDSQDVLLFRTQKVNYDDIIVFYCDDPGLEKNLIKRVIGKPGDVIKSVYDPESMTYHLYRNGALVDEDHTKEPMLASPGGWREFEVTVPEGSLFILGDNRNHSTDSSEGLFADIDKIEGVAFLLIDKEKGSFSFIK